MQTFTPREIVSELDKYIIGQKDAKRCRHHVSHPWVDLRSFFKNIVC